MAISTAINLTDLPLEILQQVCASFCLHCQGNQPSLSPGVGTLRQRHYSQQRTDENVNILARQALFSLCLTSKRIQHAVQPVLYHEFALGFGTGCTSSRTWHGRFSSFVRTVAARRDLAHLVRVVHLSEVLLKAISVDEARNILLEAAGVTDTDIHGRGRNVDDLDRKKGSRQWDFASFLANYLDEQGNLTKGQRADPMWALPVPTYDRRQSLIAEFACMLMALLPNAQSINIERGCNLPKFGLPQPFLQAISMGNGNFTSIPDIEFSPGLQLLSICNVQADKMKELPNMPNLKSLHLVGMYMSERELRNVLDRCTGKLHTFVYEACLQPSHLGLAPKDYHFFPSDVGNCLANHRGSLRSLHLDLRLHWYSIQYSNFEPRLLLHLKEFTALETVLLSSDLLFKPNFEATFGYTDEDCQYIKENEYVSLTKCLPDNAATLHVVHHNGVVAPYTKSALMDLAVAKGQQIDQFPNLCCVTVTSDIAHRFADGTITEKFEACGVGFEFTSWLT